MLSKSAMMAMTTRSSMSVNPLFLSMAIPRHYSANLWERRTIVLLLQRKINNELNYLSEVELTAHAVLSRTGALRLPRDSANRSQ
jgi:hypothetical protein